MNSKMNVQLSIVIPVFNEEENIEPLYNDIIKAVSGKYDDFEIIFINDGSIDGSLEQMLMLHEKDKRVKIIEFMRNFGQSAAISAGFSRATGNIIIPLDGDLQNDPADIPLFVEKIKEGYDMVNGWRANRKDNLFLRKIPSYLGNKLISSITGVKLRDSGCTMRAFTRKIAKNLILYGEMHRYIPAIASRFGVKSVEIPVSHRERKFGKSKYGLGRTFRLILDLISIKYFLTFSFRPLHFFGSLGLLSMGSGFISGLYLVYERFFVPNAILSHPLLFFSILTLILGFQMIFLGLVAEMMNRLYYEGLKKNIYYIDKEIGWDGD